MKITLEEFKKKFSIAIEDDAINELGNDSNFKDLESWDSFSGMSIISMIDEEFGVTIKTDEMSKTNSINELYDLISSKLN